MRCGIEGDPNWSAEGSRIAFSGGTFCRTQCEIPAAERRTLNVEELFGAWLLRVVARPCNCRIPFTLNRLRLKEVSAYLRNLGSPVLPLEMRIKDIVAHLFDYHVIEQRNWTLDRLATWLQPLEPSESAEITLMNREEAPRRNFEAEASEWRKTREAFEAQVKAKNRRSFHRVE